MDVKYVALHVPVLRANTYKPHEVWFHKVSIEQGLILPGTEKLGTAIRVGNKRILFRNYEIRIVHFP